MNGRRIARYAHPQPLSAKHLSAPVILRRRFSTRSTILWASATASAIAATYAGLFCGTVANFRAVRIAATIAITACLRFGSTTRLGIGWGLGTVVGLALLVGGFLWYSHRSKPEKPWNQSAIKAECTRPYSQYNLIERSVTSETWSTGRNLSDLRRHYRPISARSHGVWDDGRLVG
jgi:hypothetical protein